MQDYVFGNIHMFSRENRNFLFDGDMLNLYEIDSQNYGYIYELMKQDVVKNSSDSSCKELIEELTNKKVLVNINEYEKEINDIKNSKTKRTFSHLTLGLANDCNLNCKYCFGKGGTYNQKRELMSYDTAKKCVDFLITNSVNRELGLQFFGGEPLMNFDVLEKTIAYCKEVEKIHDKVISFAITTNGTILNEHILDVLLKNNVNITFSIDGPKDVHDSYRCFRNGFGSFDIVKNNLERIKLKNYKRISARATICGENLDLNQIETELLNMGFNSTKMTIVDDSEDSPLFVREGQIDELLENYKILAEKYIEDIKTSNKNRSRVFDEVIISLYNKRIRLECCGAATSSIAVNYQGKIFPCHRFMGNDEYIIGDLNFGFYEDKIDVFKKLNVLKIDGCNSCWARYLCAGLCVHTRAMQSGIYKNPKFHCELYKGFYEIALYVYYSLKQWDENVFINMFTCKENNN